MRLDTKHLRYLTSEDWRVLTAVETGSKNHEVVPTPLIVQLSSLRSGSGVHKSISTLAKANLIARTKNAKYDGYRLTYGGLDYLALHTHLKRDCLHSLGSCIGTGKESDLYICTSSPTASHDTPKDKQVLKIHRLGRTSFRTIKTNRDYLRHRQSASWLYMSRLSAQKEFIFMKALHDHGFQVPTPVAWNRHTVVMSLIDGVPLRAVKEVGDPAALYSELMQIIMRLAQHGLIHADFNEFNIIIQEAESPTADKSETLDSLENRGEDLSKTDRRTTVIPWIIDLPQAVSIDHPNAEFYFNRDVECIKTFFERKFNFTSTESGPFYQEARDMLKVPEAAKAQRLDVKVEASGFSRKMAKELEKYMRAVGIDEAGAETSDLSHDSEAEHE